MRKRKQAMVLVTEPWITWPTTTASTTVTNIVWCALPGDQRGLVQKFRDACLAFRLAWQEPLRRL